MKSDFPTRKPAQINELLERAKADREEDAEVSETEILRRMEKKREP